MKGAGVTEAQEKGSRINNRSDKGENNAAQILAEEGYDVKQLPENNPPPQPNPDIKLEGNIADIFTPYKETSVEDVVKNGIIKKVDRKIPQARRVVINAVEDGNPITEKQLFDEIQKRRAAGDLRELEEVILITGPPRKVVTVWPKA